MIRIFLLTMAVAFAGCKARNADSNGSQEKSIVDKKGRVFGLVPSDGQGEKPIKFEFRLCSNVVNRMAIETAKNDPAICVNPYMDSNKNPLVLAGQIFSSINDAEKNLKNRGFRKGATIATAGAAAGLAIGLYGGFVVLIACPMNVAPAVAQASLIEVGAGVAGTSAVGGYLGYSIWGANDRDTANNLEAIMSDFHNKKTADDVMRNLKTLGEEMKWTIDPRVSTF